MRIKINQIKTDGLSAQIEGLQDQVIDNVEIAESFGFTSKPSNAHGLTLPDGSTDELVLVTLHKQGKDKPDIESDEVCIYNDTDKYIKLKNNSIEIKNGNDCIITINSDSIEIDGCDITIEKDVTIEGDLTVEGDLIVEGNLEIAKDLKLTGSLEVLGQVEITGSCEINGILTVAGVNFNTHTHTYINTAGIPTQTGVPQ